MRWGRCSRRDVPQSGAERWLHLCEGTKTVVTTCRIAAQSGDSFFLCVAFGASAYQGGEGGENGARKGDTVEMCFVEALFNCFAHAWSTY